MATRFVTFIRHSIAGKPAKGEGDRERTLTRKGIALAKRRRDSLADLGPFDLAIASNRVRTQQTARIVVASDAQMIVNRLLFEQPNGRDENLMSDWYARMGNQTLRRYIKEGSRREVGVLHIFAARGWDIIAREVRKNPPAKNVLVVNHGLYAPAIIQAACGTRHYRCLLDRVWSECDGVTLRLRDERVVKVTPLPSLS